MVFGKRKAAKAAPVEDSTPDLVVPTTVGMPGFTEEPTPETGTPGFSSVGAPALPQTPVAQEQAAVAAAVAAPAPAPVPAQPVIPEQYQILAAEITPEGLFRYVLVTNKKLGDVGGVYNI